MLDNKETSKSENQLGTDWWSQHVGNRGLLQLLIGKDAASFALALFAGGLVYVITVQQDHGPLGSVIWLLGVLIIVNYFDKVVTQIIRLIEALRKRKSVPIALCTSRRLRNAEYRLAGDAAAQQPRADRRDVVPIMLDDARL